MGMHFFEGFYKDKPIENRAEDIVENSLIKEIENAKNEWEYAQRRFNDVSDPFVIDYIIYYIIAAERRYMYLLNKYKDMYRGKRIVALQEIGVQQLNKDILKE